MPTSRKEEGFIFMESLISLSILALFLGVVFPFFIELFTLREQAKTNLETSRFLYETALFWNGEDKEAAFSSGEVDAVSRQETDSITIYLEGDHHQSTKIESIIWAYEE